MKRNLPDPIIALLFAVATLVARIPTFYRSVLDWDESLYFLMAQQWRLGHLPYTTIWDNKPIGIYVIFAIFQTIFGDHVFAIRIASVVVISLLAFTVFKITETLTADRKAALLSGATVIICSLSNDGLSSNTELFMASFTALAVLTVLTTDLGLLAGVLIGVAFMIKYVAVFEAPAIFFLFLFRQRRVSAGVAMVVGAAIPLAATILLYAGAGRLGLWWDYSVMSNFRRVDTPITDTALHYAFRTEARRWNTMFLSGLAMLVWSCIRRRGTDIFLSFWLLGGIVGVVSSKSFYDHYFLQVLPVLCVIFGTWFSRLAPRKLPRLGYILAGLALPVWAAQHATLNIIQPDVPAIVAAGLKAQHPASIYVFDTEPIIYTLTGLPPPTRYVLPTELTGNFLPHVAGVDAVAEVARIAATNPQFIIRRSDLPNVFDAAVYVEIDRALAAHYHLWQRYNGVLVYRLN